MARPIATRWRCPPDRWRGGFGFCFLEIRALAYAKHPNSPAWLFDPEAMKPMVNNPARVQAIQDVMDLIKAGAYPTNQINADPGTTAFQQFLAGTGSMLKWWGDLGSSARTSDTSVVGDVVGFGVNPASDRVYNAKDGAWEETRNEAPQYGLHRHGSAQETTDAIAAALGKNHRSDRTG